MKKEGSKRFRKPAAQKKEGENIMKAGGGYEIMEWREMAHEAMERRSQVERVVETLYRVCGDVSPSVRGASILSLLRLSAKALEVEREREQTEREKEQKNEFVNACV